MELALSEALVWEAAAKERMAEKVRKTWALKNYVEEKSVEAEVGPECGRWVWGVERWIQTVGDEQCVGERVAQGPI